jgi:hypothetical protein
VKRNHQICDNNVPARFKLRENAQRVDQMSLTQASQVNSRDTPSSAAAGRHQSGCRVSSPEIYCNALRSRIDEENIISRKAASNRPGSVGFCRKFDMTA